MPLRSRVLDALSLLRRDSVGWLTAIVLVQGALVLLALPVLDALFRLFLRLSALDGLNQRSILLILTSPVELLLLCVYAATAAAFVIVNIAIIAALSHEIADGFPLTPRTGLRALRRAMRPLASWQSPLLAVYALLIVPLAHLGLGSTLTSHIAIPAFVSGELVKTTSGLILYIVVMAGIVYLGFRLLATIAVLTRGEYTVLGAMRRSFTLTGRMQLRLAILLVSIAVAVGLVTAVAALLGLVPAALTPNAASGPVVAATVTVVGAIRFFAVGAGTVVLTMTLVLCEREESRDPARTATPRVPAQRREIRGARIVAVTALGLAAVSIAAQATAAALATPHVPADGRTLVIAHRGYTATGVENSIEALRGAAALGADMVELDIQETADGGFVVIHDTNLSRLAGRNDNVYDLTTAELRATPIHQDGFTSTIPTLEQFAAVARELGMPLLIEVKPHGHESPGFGARVATAVNKIDPTGVSWLQTLDRGTLQAIETADPRRTTAFVVGLQLGDLPRTDADAIAIEDWSFADVMLASATAQNQRVLVWTINDPRRIRDYLNRGVDGIITDEVAVAVVSRALAEEIDNGVSLYLQRVLPLVAP